MCNRNRLLCICFIVVWAVYWTTLDSLNILWTRVGLQFSAQAATVELKFTERAVNVVYRYEAFAQSQSDSISLLFSSLWLALYKSSEMSQNMMRVWAISNIAHSLQYSHTIKTHRLTFSFGNEALVRHSRSLSPFLSSSHIPFNLKSGEKRGQVTGKRESCCER